MPPKGSKVDPKAKKPSNSKGSSESSANKSKANVAAAPVKSAPTPEKKRPASSIEKADTDAAPPKRAKAKQTATFKKLCVDLGASAPIDVSFEGDIEMSPPAKLGGFMHSLKLEAPGPFSLVKTIVFPEGSEHAGHQAIIIRPAKSFPFMKLPPEVRNRIYQFFFASQSDNSKIVFDGRRASNKEVFAKTYAGGSKHRASFLAVNKEINKEATPILYAHSFRFESAATLLDFLTQMPVSVRTLLRSIEIKAYTKTSARNTFSMLSEATNLQKLRIENGISTSETADVAKTVKAFYTDAFRFLEAMGAVRGAKDAGVDIIEFGEFAFICNNDGDKEPWDEDDVEEFTEKLRGRLKTKPLYAWACICGSVIYGHTCGTELERQLREKEAWEHLGHGGAAMMAEL